MIVNFMSMVVAIITFFGIVIPVWHWLTTGWKEAEQKGTNPYITSIFSVFVGFAIGFTIVGAFLSIASYMGFPTRIFNCYYFSGGDTQMCENDYSQEYQEAKQNGFDIDTLNKESSTWQ